MVLKTGTKTIAARPKYNMVDPYLCITSSSSVSFSSIFPLKTGNKEATKTGTTTQTTEGMKRYEISFNVVTLLAIHNMVVVTSPIGDQAPPAFADIIISPANQSRVSRSPITFCKIVIKTIVAVRLSMIADNMNASIAKIQSRAFLDLVLMNDLMVENPLK